MGKGTKTTQTSENRIAPWMENAAQGLTQDATQLLGGGQSFIAPQSQDMLNFFDLARNFQGSGDQFRALAGQGYTPQTFAPAQATNAGNVGDIMGAPTIAARQGSEFMGDYMDPYLQDVVNASLLDYDTGVGRSMAGRQATADAGSAFGNRRAIADAVYQADTERGRGALSAGLRSNAFDTAAGLGMQDAGRFLTADQANAANILQTQMQNQANQARNVERENQTGQFNAGQYNAVGQFNLGEANAASRFNQDQTMRALGAAEASDLGRLGLLGQSGQMQNEYAQRVAQEPIDLLAARNSLLSGLPYSSTQTATSRSNPGLLGTIGGLGTLAFGLGSLGWNPFGAAAGGGGSLIPSNFFSSNAIR